MLNLPKRKQVITVTPDDYEGVHLLLSSPSPQDVFRVMDDVDLSLGDIEEGVAELPPSAAGRLIDFFMEKLVSIDGLQVDGEPFDADDDDHCRSLPVDLMMDGAAALIEYPFVTGEMGKDSGLPAEEPPRAPTSSNTSPTANVG